MRYAALSYPSLKSPSIILGDYEWPFTFLLVSVAPLGLIGQLVNGRAEDNLDNELKNQVIARCITECNSGPK
jgi:hypothetical protein